MDWQEKLNAAREWWESADSDTRYLIIVGLSGGLTLLATVLAMAAPPKESLHRVRIEN